MAYQHIIIEIDDYLGLITIDRPKKLNALNKETISELHDAFKTLDDDKDVRVIIITGSGEKAFVAGADIAEFANFDMAHGRELSRKGQTDLFDLVAHLSTPVIAAINGFALGGGLELAMASHIRVASSNAKMGLPEVSLGLIPGYGGTQRLPQLVGKGKALEMITTGGMIDADEALAYRLVNHVVSQEELLSFCEDLAKKIARNSPMAISAAIKAVNANYKESVNGFDVEIEAFGNCFGTDDFEEGTSAFLEKRRPKF
ncbi:enoyl-CoA hydratase/isomerase family protein [Lutimonas vermicola]|uniref:Enoyl-CoA hydratase-related protein n=1 Tax=Lutimonas vermicola TaxID=414288 RepID=A0ABU9L645_9FLAO